MAVREMKDSGIDWIGMMPNVWNLKPLKHCVNLKTTKCKTKGRYVGLEHVKSWEGQLISSTDEEPIAEGDTLTFTKGDVLFGKLRPYLAKCFFALHDGSCSTEFLVLKPTNIDGLFLKFSLLTSSFIDTVNMSTNGVKMPRANWDFIGTIKMPIPDIKEQIAIANFLDTKCAEIDTLTSDIEKQIETLQEYKKSVITEAVTKGLDPNVEMKVTEYTWINSVPSTWKCELLKRSFSFGKGLPITKADLEDEGISVLSYGQIHSKNNKGYHLVQKLLRYVAPNYQNEYPNCLVKQGDILIADTSEDLEGIGNSCVNDIEIPLFAGYHTLILRNRNINLNSRYCAYQFLSQNWRNQLRALANGIKVFSITQKILKQVQILIPPIEEQNKIVDYLDHRCCEIEKIISDKEKQIEVLAKYKQSLIYEVVTGKKEIE